MNERKDVRKRRKVVRSGIDDSERSTQQQDSVLHIFSKTVDVLLFNAVLKLFYDRNYVEMVERAIPSLENAKSLDLKLLPVKISILICLVYIFYDIMHHIQSKRILCMISSSLLLYDLWRMAFNCTVKMYFLNVFHKLDLNGEEIKTFLKENFESHGDNPSIKILFETSIQWDTIVVGTFWRFAIAPLIFLTYKCMA